MRWMVLGTVLLVAACDGGSGGSSRQQACEHVCGCLSFPTPQAGSECVLECVSPESGGQVELSTQACIDCAAEATCAGINNGTACAVECDTSSSSL